MSEEFTPEEETVLQEAEQIIPTDEALASQEKEPAGPYPIN